MALIKFYLRVYCFRLGPIFRVFSALMLLLRQKISW